MEAGPLDRRRDARAAAARRGGGGARRRAVRWLALSAAVTGAGGANWAQHSGEAQQNVVIPYLPNTERPHWSGRTGLALCQSNISQSGENAGQPKVGAASRLFVMGGDDWLREEHPPMVGKGGGYLNDVWETMAQPSDEWHVQPSSPLNVVPIVKSRISW